MGPRKFKEMRNRISGLTLAQKQRLTVEIQASVQHDGLPEQVRRREAGTGPVARLHPLRCDRGCASREVGRLASLSLPLGVLQKNLSRVDRDASYWLETQVQMVRV